MEISGLRLLDRTAKRELVIASFIIILLGVLFTYDQNRQKQAIYSQQIINLAGKQRMLSQRISYLQHLVVTDNSASLRSTWQAEMRLLLDEFESSHEILAGRKALLEDFTMSLSDELSAFYRNGTGSLDSAVAEFLQINRATARVGNANSLNFYTPEQAAFILGKLDTAVTMHEQQYKQLAQNISVTTTIIWVLGIGLLIIFLRILTRPLRQEIQQHKETQNETDAELKAAKEELEHQIEQRSIYINKITHDLRSPVSAIISVLDLLPNSRGEMKNLLRQAEMACQRLLKYTDDLADIIKPSADTGVERRFNLISLLDDSMAKTANACELKGLSFDVASQQELPKIVNGYPRVIRKCLENVLENAVMYTKEGSISVNFAIAEQEAGVMLNATIADTGEGIQAHHVELIFERFKRLPGNTLAGENLTGLGLAITRECIEAVGGSVTVFSHVGHGSTFTLQFPLARVAREELKPEPVFESHREIRFAIIDDFEISRQHLEQLVDNAGYSCDVYASSINFFEHKEKISMYSGIIIDYYMPGLNGEELLLTLNAMLGEKMPPVIMVSSSPDIANIVANSRIKAFQVFTKPIMENRFVDALQQLVDNSGVAIPEKSGNILLVEDETINAEMMVYMLTNMGYITKVAPDGQTALSLTEAFSFDCILLDMHLPDMDGHAVIERLRDSENSTPVIVISGDTTDSTEIMALEAGVRYYLFKPVPFQELKNTLKLTLSKRARV